MNKFVSCSKMFLQRNSSTILTCVGGVGVIATSVMAVKATPKALKIIEKVEEEKGEKLTKMEVVKVAGPIYIPTVITGMSTIACIFGANILNKKQQAALISAYTVLDSSYKEYKKKVEELYGDDADINVRTEIAKDHYEDEDIELDDGKELFYDESSQRYFSSTMADVIEAEYNLNRELAIHDGVSLNEFYKFLGLPLTTEGKELGWSSGILESMYWAQWIEFDHTKAEMDDGLECTIITMRYEPVIDFAYY